MLYLPHNVYEEQQFEEWRRQELLCRVEVDRLLCEAGIDQRGWLSRLNGRLLGQLGHVLVTWGERLERYEAASGGQSLRHQAI